MGIDTGGTFTHTHTRSATTVGIRVEFRDGVGVACECGTAIPRMRFNKRNKEINELACMARRSVACHRTRTVNRHTECRLVRLVAGSATQ